MLNIVEKYDDVVKNADEFNKSIENHEDLIKKLSLFRHWYYIKEIDGFATSKFIGYKDITVDEYKIGTSYEQGYMDGRSTVRQLKCWFKQISVEDYEYYYKKLKDFLSMYDKIPNKKIQLYYKK